MRLPFSKLEVDKPYFLIFCSTSPDQFHSFTHEPLHQITVAVFPLSNPVSNGIRAWKKFIVKSIETVKSLASQNCLRNLTPPLAWIPPQHEILI